VPPRHAKVIDRLRERYADGPEVIAMLVIGSVARGDARDDSDIDCLLVVSEAELERRKARSELSFSADDLFEDAPGHAGGGIVDLKFLREVADHGPEPARYAFTAAQVIISRDPEIAALLREIPVYQESERAEKMLSFASQLPVHMSYLELGEYSRNAWLLAETAVELVLFGGRLILAHNRVLFPNRKQFMRVLAAAPEKPEGLVAAAETLTRQPSIATARRFYESVMSFRDWPIPAEGPWARFQLDRETNWRKGPPALADS
jgi:predicted nucleotidyltransferase